MEVSVTGLSNEAFSKNSIAEESESFFDHALKAGLTSLHFNFKTHNDGGRQRFELTLTGSYKGKEYHVSNLHDKESQWDINTSLKCVLKELKKILLRQKEKGISLKKERDKTLEV